MNKGGTNSEFYELYFNGTEMQFEPTHGVLTQPLYIVLKCVFMYIASNLIWIFDIRVVLIQPMCFCCSK